MNRRTVLRGMGALLTSAGLAGCIGEKDTVPMTARAPPDGVGDAGGDVSDGGADAGDGGGQDETEDGDTGRVRIRDFDALEGSTGNLVVTITVTNDTSREQVRYVRAVVTMGDSQLEPGRFLTLGAGQTETVSLPVDVRYSAWLGNGGFTPEVLERTPETPVPTATATPSSTATDTGTATTAGDADTKNETESESGTNTEGDTDAGTDAASGTE